MPAGFANVIGFTLFSSANAFFTVNLLYLAMVVWCSPGASAQGVAITDANDLKQLNEARTLQNQGHIDAALPLAQALTKKYPKSSIAWRVTAMCMFFNYQSSRSPTEVRFCAERALALDPNDSSCYQLMADIENESGHFARAIMFATKGLEHKPIDPRCYRSRSSSYTNLKKYEEAYADYKTYLQLAPNLAVARTNRMSKARLADSAGHLQDALDIYASLQKEKYGDSIPPLQAALYVKMHKNDAAINILNELIAKIPNDEEAYAARAKLFESMGRLQDAVKDYGAAIAIDDEATYYLGRAAVYDKLGQKEKAAQDRKSAESVRSF